MKQSMVYVHDGTSPAWTSSGGTARNIRAEKTLTGKKMATLAQGAVVQGQLSAISRR